MKYTIFLLLFFFVLQIGSAQVAYEQGYFIDNNGKRKACLIKDRGWKNNPSSITYRLSEDTPEITLESYDMKEFGIGNGIRYSRQRIALEISSDKITNLSNSPDLNLVDTVVLLKHEVEGKASLFSFCSNFLANRYFYQIDADSIKPLIYRLHSPDGIKIIKNTLYKEQLRDAISCGEGGKYVQRMSYNLPMLRKFFTRYNQCQESNYHVLNEYQKKAQFTFTPKVGVEYASVEASNTVTSMYGSFPNKIGPRIGLELEYIIPYFKNQWSIFADPSFVSYHANSTTSPSMEIQYNSIDIPIGLRKYFFIRNHSAISLNVFTAFNIDINSQLNTRNTPLKTGSNMNFGGAVGYVWKGKYVAQLKYNLPKNITADYLFWQTKYRSTSLTFGYRFGGR